MKDCRRIPKYACNRPHGGSCITVGCSDYREMSIRELIIEIDSDTESSSFGTDRVNHPLFKEITTKGMDAVPGLVSLLDTDPERLVATLALCAIIGEPRIPKEHYGKLSIITEYWKKWYKNNLTTVDPIPKCHCGKPVNRDNPDLEYYGLCNDCSQDV